MSRPCRYRNKIEAVADILAKEIVSIAEARGRTRRTALLMKLHKKLIQAYNFAWNYNL